jgi:hypothetical protein
VAASPDDDDLAVIDDAVEQTGKLLAGGGVGEFDGHKKYLHSVQDYCTVS